MSETFRITETFPVGPDILYSAWLDSETHTRMTGGKARVTDQVGEEFTAWDGYITGTNLELQPPLRIFQSWRTSDFQQSEPDSLLEITFIREGDQTRVIIRHSNLPEDGARYQKGWVDAYFNPMKEYFKS